MGDIEGVGEGPAVLVDGVGEFEDVGGEEEAGLEAVEGGWGGEADFDVEDEGVDGGWADEGEFVEVAVVAAVDEAKGAVIFDGELEVEDEHVIDGAVVAEVMVADGDVDGGVGELEVGRLGEACAAGVEAGDEGFFGVGHSI